MVFERRPGARARASRAPAPILPARRGEPYARPTSSGDSPEAASPRASLLSQGDVLLKFGPEIVKVLFCFVLFPSYGP